VTITEQPSDGRKSDARSPEGEQPLAQPNANSATKSTPITKSGLNFCKKPIGRVDGNQRIPASEVAAYFGIVFFVTVQIA
jgi:hypothetical protein